MSEFTPVIDGARRAFNSFSAMLQENYGLDAKTADKVTGYYLRHKLAKSDAIMGRITVKHGAFLEPDVIARAAEAVNS